MLWIVIIIGALLCISQVANLTIGENSRLSNLKKPAKVLAIPCTVFLIAYGVIASMPKRADPIIQDLNFYAYGIPNKFNFLCESIVVNEGDKACELVQFDFVLDKTKFRFGKTALVTKGATYMGFSGIKPMATCSNLPGSIAAKNTRQFTFLGEATGNLDVADFPGPIEIRIVFEADKRRISMNKSVPIVTQVQVQNVRLE